MKKKVIAYVHFHWDREWYREFEIFRMRLLRAFDSVLDMLETNKLPSFYFDGQTAALLDYLEMRPEKEEQIRHFIKEKRLFIGPFYCLVDEFLTDEKCFRKNLELGLKTAKDFGCNDFVGYFADTFGHSANTIPILKEFGIDTAVVWRGCGDIPAEFTWNGINTINLVRGYFNDVFSTPWDMNKKAEFLKNNLDKIAEKSGNTILLPVGADHLGVEQNLKEQIEDINKLLDGYEITIGTIFDYIEAVKDRFSQYKQEGELRDNSKTFILEGSYSSRNDIKRYNTISSYKLDIADRLVKYYEADKYQPLIEYAYRLLIQNQAHDSICGCSTDDVHSENITRYKKILQIADTIVDELTFEGKENKIINLSDEEFSGVLKFYSTNNHPYQVISQKRGFDKKLLTDTQRIPVTEDYTDIYKYALHTSGIKTGENNLIQTNGETDVFITDNCIGNSHIYLLVENGNMVIGNKTAKFVDYIDNGDSYNTGYSENDEGTAAEILSSKVLKEGTACSVLGVEVKSGNDILNIEISLGKDSKHLDFNISWTNTKKNHLLEFVIDTLSPVTKTFSEDLGQIIERTFDSDYNPRENLPKEKGIEVKSNNAPMQRGVCANDIGIVTCGLTQYEVFKNELRLPILRATGVISNPENPARTTPAGPPIKTDNLQMLGENKVSYSIFLGNDLKEQIENIYHKCVIL